MCTQIWADPEDLPWHRNLILTNFSINYTYIYIFVLILPTLCQSLLDFWDIFTPLLCQKAESKPNMLCFGATVPEARLVEPVMWHHHWQASDRRSFLPELQPHARCHAALRGNLGALRWSKRVLKCHIFNAPKLGFPKFQFIVSNCTATHGRKHPNDGSCCFWTGKTSNKAPKWDQRCDLDSGRWNSDSGRWIPCFG